MKEIDKSDLRKLSSINFYKHINKISTHKNRIFLPKNSSLEKKNEYINKSKLIQFNLK